MPTSQQSRSAKLEFTDHLKTGSNDQAGMALFFHDDTLFPYKYERASWRNKKKGEEKVEFEVEKSTKNSNIIKVTGIIQVYRKM